jgi:hypothetical protein
MTTDPQKALPVDKNAPGKRRCSPLRSAEMNGTTLLERR